MSEHPKDRPIEAQDPFQMMAGGVAGDPAVMFDCLVEEYSRLGYGAAELLALFANPQFLATHGLRELFGPDATRTRVRTVLSRCGVLRVTAKAAPPDPFSCSGRI